MFAQRSLLLAAASAFTLSTVLAHPHGPAHVHQHAKRQDSVRLSYVTLYQTQPHGPEGTADMVYTITSPVWVTDGAAVGTGTLPVATPEAPVETPVETPSEDPDEATSAASSASTFAPPPVPTLPVEKGRQPPSVPKASSTTAVVQSTTAVVQPSPTLQPVPNNSTEPEASAPPEEGSGSGTASGEHKDYGSNPNSYPPSSSWLSFDALLQAQKGTTDSRGMWSKHITDDQIDTLVKAIKTVASKYSIDDRIILAMVNQESQGDVTVESGGLMQAIGYNAPVGGQFQGVGWLCDASTGRVTALAQLDCAVGNHYRYCSEKYPDSNNMPWKALFCYNSGYESYEKSGSDLKQSITHPYCTDIASRLVTGWTQ